MLKQTTIKVIQKDIDNGVRVNCYDCPIALSLRRKYKAARSIEVGGSRADIHYKNHIKYITLPKSLVNFISRFDENLPVKPITVIVKYKTEVI